MLYQPRSSLLHRLHPHTKLAISCGLITLALGLPSDSAPLELFALVLVPLSVLGGVGRPFLSVALRMLLPFAISLFVIQSLFYPGGRTALLTLGPLSVTREGVRFAYGSTVRLLLIIGALLLTLQTTHPGVLLSGLVQKGFPPNLAYVIVTTLQIVPQMRDRAALISDAQRSRGLETEGSLWVRARALVPLVGPLVLGALLDVEERGLALEARAFGATTPKTSLIALPDPVGERVLRWAILLLIVTVLIWRLAVALGALG